MSNGTAEIVLSAKDVVKGYELGATKVDVLKGVSLDVRSGEALAIVGASGAGADPEAPRAGGQGGQGGVLLPGGQDALDRRIARVAEAQGAVTGSLEPLVAVALAQLEQPLHGG